MAVRIRWELNSAQLGWIPSLDACAMHIGTPTSLRLMSVFKLIKVIRSL